jgi:hypothetical protein
MWRSVLLILGLCGVLAGCSWDAGGLAGSGATSGGTERAVSPVIPELKTLVTIQIRALTGQGSKVIRSATVACGPADTAGVCLALRDYARNHAAPLRMMCNCPGAPAGTRFAVVEGRVNGKPIKAELTWCTCGYPQRIIRDLRTITSLRRLAVAQ